jgi:DNA-binding MarR family transcriptional regulator
MDRDGLIRRSRVASDQRKVIVSLTPQSQALVKRISPLIDEQYRSLEHKIGAKTLAEAYRLLDTLIETLPGDAPADSGGDASHSTKRAMSNTAD